jgi:hypothetical protein
MKIHEFDDEIEIADEMIRAIEKDYGRMIARIPFFERTGRCSFDMKVIFTDFRLLEATIVVSPFFDELAQIQVHGIYY